VSDEAEQEGSSKNGAAAALDAGTVAVGCGFEALGCLSLCLVFAVSPIALFLF
jgi:hypothetical protein